MVVSVQQPQDIGAILVNVALALVIGLIGLHIVSARISITAEAVDYYFAFRRRRFPADTIERLEIAAPGSIGAEALVRTVVMVRTTGRRVPLRIFSR